MSAPPPTTQDTPSTALGIHIEMLESANAALSRRNEETQTLLRELIKNNMKLTEKILQSREEHEKEKDLAELRQKREERVSQFTTSLLPKVSSYSRKC
jgi:exonuclease VII large subunit